MFFPWFGCSLPSSQSPILHKTPKELIIAVVDESKIDEEISAALPKNALGVLELSVRDGKVLKQFSSMSWRSLPQSAEAFAKLNNTEAFRERKRQPLIMCKNLLRVENAPSVS